MYTHLQLAAKYLRYYATASNGRGHGIHSPFVYDFVRNVLMDKKKYPAYDTVEELRRKLMNDKTMLHIEDMGAGSTVTKSNQRSVSSIVKNAAKPAKYGQLLFRMNRYYQPATSIELGTSLGLTSAYLSLANPAGRVFTLEGATEVAKIARGNFDKLKLLNTILEEGNFDNSLPDLLKNTDSIDFAFIDGNHRMLPTIQYFETLLAKTNNLSIIILDDIHWSADMEKAWDYCKSHASVTLSIDLFFIGILVFRKEIMEKQHFVIRF